jgi:hypothetical protein
LNLSRSDFSEVNFNKKGNYMTRKEALIKFLGCEVDKVHSPSGFFGEGDGFFSFGDREYMVLLDSEADERAKENIKEDIWAFNSYFLASHAKDGIDVDVIGAIQDNGKCESNNKALTALIKDYDHFVNDAIRCDGRGHFMNIYDGEENEMGEYFIYRLN